MEALRSLIASTVDYASGMAPKPVAEMVVPMVVIGSLGGGLE